MASGVDRCSVGIGYSIANSPREPTSQLDVHQSALCQNEVVEVRRCSHTVDIDYSLTYTGDLQYGTAPGAPTQVETARYAKQ